MGNHWDNLSMREKMAFMKVGLDNGLTDVESIRNAYNKFAAGGSRKTAAVAPQASSTSYIPSLSRKYYTPTNTRSLGGRIRRRRVRKFSGEDDDNPTQLMPFDDSYVEELGTTPTSVELVNNATFPSMTYDEAMAFKRRAAATGSSQRLVATLPDIVVTGSRLTPEQSLYIHSPAMQLAQRDKPLESVYPEAALLSLGRLGWTSPSLYKAAWSGAKDLGKAIINPGGVADAMFSSAPTFAAPSIPILGATTPAGIAINALGIGLPAAEAAQYMVSPHGLREASWKSPEPYMQGLALAPLAVAGVGRAATEIPRAWNATLNALKNRYGFIQTPNSFTRGIGGEPGLQDLIQSGVIRGNPRGTEISPLGWDSVKFAESEPDLEKRFPGIANRYYRRQLSREEFEAIKARAQEKAAEEAAAATTNPSLTISSDVIDRVRNNLNIAAEIDWRKHGLLMHPNRTLYPDPFDPTDLNVDYTTSPLTKFGPMRLGWNGFARPTPSEGYPAGVAINARTVQTPTEQAQTLLHEKHHMFQHSNNYPSNQKIVNTLEEAYPLDFKRVNSDGSDLWTERASTNAEIRSYLIEKYGENNILDPSFNPPLLWRDSRGIVHTILGEMEQAGYPISAYMNDYAHGIASQLATGSADLNRLSKNIWKAIQTVPVLVGGGLFTGAMLRNNTGDATTATNGQIRALGGNLFEEGSYMDPPPTSDNSLATVGDFSLGKDLSIHSDEHPYIASAINMATGMIPVIGDVQDIATMIDNPSWANAGQLALDAVSYVPGLRWAKLMTKPARKAAAVESAYKAANKAAPGKQRKAALRKVREENGELKARTQRKNSAERKALIENATKKGKRVQTGAQVLSGIASGAE